jgi:drug/metabolite transporter (DMT)-like permease
MALGDLLTLSNALSFSLFLVLSKSLLSRTDAISATAVLMAFGTAWIALVGWPELLALDVGAVSASTWALVGYIIVFPTAGAYLLQYWALTRVESSVVAFFIYLQPLVATTLSVLLFGERPALRVFIGGALIFAGVYLALRRAPISR